MTIESTETGGSAVVCSDLLADRKRLDWLEENQVTCFSWTQDDQYGEPSRKLWQCDSVGLEKARDNIRDAIDAAMSANDQAERRHD